MNNPHHDIDKKMNFVMIHPTVFFVDTAKGLRQGVDITLNNNGDVAKARLHCLVGTTKTTIDLGTVNSGMSQKRVYIPDIRTPLEVTFTLQAYGQEQARQTQTWTPQRHWELYVVPSSHHDLGYTDLPSHVLRQHDDFLDDVVHFCDETADWPDDVRFRYTIEQAWSVLHYIENRPPDAVARLISLMREGRVELTAFFGNQTSALCGSEEQVRLLYPAFRLVRRYSVPIHTAELNDVPGLSWGLVTALHGAGIRYFAPSLPDYFSWGFKVRAFWDEHKVLPRDSDGAFWWEGPDDSRVLLWYTGAGVELWTYDQAMRDVPNFLKHLTERGYELNLVRVRFQGGRRDNSPPDMRLSMIAREWNQRWAYPHLIVSSNTRFFQILEQHAGNKLPVLRGDLPNTDYTLGAASTARVTGINRLTHDILAAAEAFATCASQISDTPYPADTLNEAYDAMLLYDEHTWGMAHPIGPAQDACWSQKQQFAYRAAALAHDTLVKSTNRIADHIFLPEDGYHLVIFNALAHTRTDVVIVPAVQPSPASRPMYWRHPAEGEMGTSVWVLGNAIGRDLIPLPQSMLEVPFELIDMTTGDAVPYQLSVVDDPLAPSPMAAERYALGVNSGFQHKDLLLDPAHRISLVFVAQDVPAIGYKTYRIAPVAAWPVFECTLQVEKHILENRFYRITLDPERGAVASIFDKHLQREWVDVQSLYGVNQLVIRSVQDGQTTGPDHVDIMVGEKGPVRATLIVHGQGSGCPQLVQEITLYNTVKRIDFANRVLKDATPFQDVVFAFPFAIDTPNFRYDAANSVINPISDQLPGTSTSAYAIQHWVSVGDGNGEIRLSSLEAPIVALGHLWTSPVSQAHHGVTPPGYGQDFLRDPTEFDRGHVYSYAMVNNFRTNFQPVQSGDVLFRYAMTSCGSAEAPEVLRDFGQAQSTPLVPVCILGRQHGPLALQSSFFTLDQDNVSLLALKGAEDGDGIIIRLCETEGRDVTVTFTLPHVVIDQALVTNLVEVNQTDLAHSRHSAYVQIPAHGIVTIRCCDGQYWPVGHKLAHF